MTAAQFKIQILPLYGAMRAMAVRMLGAEDGQDAVQDVLRKLWETRDEIEIKGPPAAYVLRTMKNRCLDNLRKTVVIETLNKNSDIEYPDDNLNELERLVLLDNAIEQLDVRKRQILKMSLSGMNGNEIAADVSMNPSNVRQLLARARQELKNILTNKN